MGSKNQVLIRYAAARRVRVLIADPFPVVLHGFRKMIEDDGRFQVVAEVSNMRAFWKAVAAEQPEVALLDWSMASQDSEITTELLPSDFRPSIVFFTITDSSEEEREIHGLGTKAVLSKGCSAEEIMTAISEACERRVLHDFRARPGAPNIFSAGLMQDPAQRISQLTKREMQLLPLVCNGMKNKEIAMRLGIAESTVWHHLTSVFTKLGVEDRLGLATFAYRHNLVPANDQPLPFQTAHNG